jgi:hypothetical protein
MLYRHREAYVFIRLVTFSDLERDEFIPIGTLKSFIDSSYSCVYLPHEKPVLQVTSLINKFSFLSNTAERK